MESKYINRYNTFCSCLQNLSRSCDANPDEPFVLEGTVQTFNLTFDIAWKVMKDILIYDEFCRFRYTASKYMIEDE